MSAASAILTFTAGPLVLAVPVGRVEEVLRKHALTDVPLAGRAIGGLMNLRGQIVLAVDLRLRMLLPPREPGADPMHVVIRTHDGLHSLLVDAIGDVIDVDGIRAERVPERIRPEVRALASNVFVLPHQVVVALDVDKILDPVALAER